VPFIQAGAIRIARFNRLILPPESARCICRHNGRNVLEKREIKLDIGYRIGYPKSTTIAATVYIPDAARLQQPPIVMFAAPGGGYGRGYFDLPRFHGELYSQAEHHAAAGIVFVAYDHLGVGDSTCPESEELTNDIIAAANDAAVRMIVSKLQEGSVSSSISPLTKLFKIGVGQSLGGCITIMMQGAYRTFDAIALLASSAFQGVLPQPTEEARLRGIAGFQRGLGKKSDSATASKGIIDFVYPFFYEDVPRDIVDADYEGGFPVRHTNPPWGSLTIPRCASLFMTPGNLLGPAASIEVPVFIGLGERDTCVEPLGEPAYFSRSSDVSVYIVPRMAHMHNFASTRETLWKRLVAWAELLAADV
jgi:pimeloyl-ACP methyl ester carboxylesterase